jgi:hypothetical protein
MHVLRNGLAALVLLAGCAHHAALREVSVTDVSDWVKAGSATVVDANSPAFRAHNGTVPGAVLLDNFRTYDTKVLGEDRARQLVFYCTNRL